MSTRTLERERTMVAASPPGGRLPREKAEDQYRMGYSGIFLELLKRRSAEKNAPHLLALLRPGMDVLDLGCGPGSITVGLAEAVAPGRVVALDSDQGQLELADEHAAMCGLDNIDLRRADALDLPFGTGEFDAVHCHGFLMHSPDVRRQLGEIRRVLSPGGIVSAREMDVAPSFISPAAHSHEIFGMLAEVVRRCGGDPLRGRHLKALFAAARFEDVRGGYSADFFETRDETEFLADFLLNWGLSREFIRITGNTGAEHARWSAQVERWQDTLGAVGCFHFGHATARKPW